MKITSSYGVEITSHNKIFIPTITIFREAVAFFIEVVNAEWDNLKLCSYDKEKMGYIEKLTHKAHGRTVKYDFDTKFYKFPCYLRRAAINSAIGCVSSYKANLENWEKSGKRGKSPKLTLNRSCYPTLYKGNMYEQLSKGYARLKLFINNDWVWVTVKLKKTDLDYLNKRVSESDCIAPTLERRRKKFFLRFAYEETVKLNTTKVCDQKICAVDLGINTDATCSVLDSNGTVAARQFTNHAAEKDRLYRVLNRIKGLQQYSGSRSAQTLWAYATRLNDELSKKIASEIVTFAIKHDCDVIVFEHLDSKGKKHGSKKQVLSLWKKNYIQEIVTHKAHQNGIRVSHVCGKNTSKLAYDGSGTVSRGKATGVNTYELCKFKNGKIYNCDLSASYNIGARYFIREFLKSLPQKVRSLVQAKVPELEHRTSCTYNSFLTMLNALGEITV